MLSNDPYKPLTFNDLMNMLRDTATSIKTIQRNPPISTSVRVTREGQESIMREDVRYPNSSTDKKRRMHTQSLETMLHQIVQYLLYFRNTDGSFGGPMVRESTR